MRPRVVWGLALIGVIFGSVPAMAAAVSQLNITGGSVAFSQPGAPSGAFVQNGVLVMGAFQPPPEIFPPVTIDSHTLSFFTDSLSGVLPPPSGQTSGASMTADLSSLFANITGPLFNGSLNIGGLATGTYDPLSGAFQISWTHTYDVLTSASFSLGGTADLAPVPLPAAIGLFLTGLMGVAGLARPRSV